MLMVSDSKTTPTYEINLLTFWRRGWKTLGDVQESLKVAELGSVGMTRLEHRATIVGVEYRVLGPLSAFSNGEPAKLGGKRQQMVLAVLLSTPNETVSQDTLIDSVWAGEPPESAIPTLHSYVSNLRKVLGGSLDREGSGYVVHLADSSLDSILFEDLSAQARSAGSPTEALEAAERALRLWHGRPFGELGDEPALIGEARRLEESRLATLEIRIEADIEVGNHAAVIQELGALTAEYPYLERLRGFLMLALYRAGRQADALRVFQETRRFLGDELGIEPSAELQQLEDQILTHDPNLDFKDRAATTAERAARGYELHEMIKETPFGELFRGFQGSIGREVAVLKLHKTISGDAKFVRRFETEMRAVSELDHPHLVPIFDFWRDPDGAYLVTALPRGASTGEILAGGPWNISAVIRFVDQVGSAISYIHRNGMVHGSLTIESVLLDQESNAYISDLGLAGLVPGSDRHESPTEDVTALAHLAFVLLAGSESPTSESLSSLRPDLAELDAIFERASHREEAGRYQKPEDFGRALRQAVGGDVVAVTSEVPTGSRRNPYKGLRAFKESEAIDFHGRDSLVEELTEAVSSNRLVTVVGPSGSGKSSLVRAGLLPALRSGAIAGSGNWLMAEMFPGTHPFEELEAAFVRVASERPAAMYDELTSDDRGLVRVAKKIVGNDGDELVVLIDQFEELFSLVSSESNRRLFLDSLTAAANDERSRLRFVLTLRADFFDQPLQYPEFGEVLSGGLIPITPPSEEGLTRAIAQPARNVGVDLQPGLVTRIIDDVRDEPGGLPLMQYALTELFNKRVNNTMTLAAYEESGGVAGALANRADEIYGDLSDEGKAAARNLFLRLVNVDEMADDTRRRVRQTELKGLSLDQTILDDVIQQFGAFRLLSFDRDAATRTPTVEVAHEALIREWVRLRTWIDDRREDLLIHRRIQVTARDWEDSAKDPSYLLRGSRLEQALVWQERTDIAITDDEMTFIEASIEQEKRDLAELQALEERSARRRKAVIGVLAGGLVVAGVLGVIALDRAQSERLTAAQATARELSGASLGALDEDQELAILLALKAVETTEKAGLDPVPEAISALRAAQSQRQVGLSFYGLLTVIYSPDGKFLVVDSAEPRDLYIRDPETGKVLRTLSPDHLDGGRYGPAAFDPADPTRLAVSRTYVYDDIGEELPDDEVVVDIFNTATGSYELGLRGPAGVYFQPSFSSSGRVAATRGDAAYVWESTGSLVNTIEFDDLWVTNAEFIPNTDVLVLTLSPNATNTTEDGAIVALDISIDEELWRIPLTGRHSDFARISPDGSMIAVSDDEAQSVLVLNLPDGSVVTDFQNGSPQYLSWSNDGSLIAVSGNTGDISVVSLAAGTDQIQLSGHESSVWGTAFAPDEFRLASVSLDGSGRVWDLSPGGGIRLDGPPAHMFSNQDGSRILLSNGNAPATILDLEVGHIETTLPLEYQLWTKQIWADDSLQVVAGVNEEGRGVIVDTTTGGVLDSFDDCVTGHALSGDGRFVLLDSQELCGANPDLRSSVLDRQTGEHVIDLGPRLIGLGIFHEGSELVDPYVAVNVGVQFIEIYSLGDNSLVATIPLSLLRFFPLILHTDPTGKYLGVGTNGSWFMVFDMEEIMRGVSPEDAVALALPGHKANVPYVQPTRDGRVLTAGHDGFYRMWSIETGELLWEIRAYGLDDFGAAAIPPTETHLIYEDAGFVVRTIPLDSNEIIELARAAVTRILTDGECSQYLHTDGCEE